MLLWYVLYSAFMCIRVYLGEIDFLIISALKSQVSPRIAGHCIMHSKMGSHFSFSLAHVCHSCRVVLIVGTFRVGQCTQIQQQFNNMNTSLLLLLCRGHDRLMLLLFVTVGSFLSVFVNSCSLPYSGLSNGSQTQMLVLCAQGGTRLHLESTPAILWERA